MPRLKPLMVELKLYADNPIGVIVGRYITTEGSLGSTDGNLYKTYPAYAYR
ncbi:hypothetical protein KOY48_00695 [Candidatus Minimicrobia naudis]|uniref:Uncharacterized protein n=1 Tax=Candidatus Minimicrobia naudis TaxID=2841263 RepID=A0A8F1MCK2_9BACT|nr:hypothetical protein KOY48_00695 [Candidatus Minimicrobia naudis]